MVGPARAARRGPTPGPSAAASSPGRPPSAVPCAGSGCWAQSVCRPRGAPLAACSPSSSSSSPDPELPLQRPTLELSAEAAVEVQMNAFANNNEPYVDHGIEVAYRFADFDPFERNHTYFGRNIDLGQFERFRRIFHTQAYRVLLKHEGHDVVSSLQVGERRFKQRVHVRGFRTGEEGTFEFTLVQKLGGLRDGYWYVSSLLADGGGDIWEAKGGQGAPMGWF